MTPLSTSDGHGYARFWYWLPGRLTVFRASPALMPHMRSVSSFDGSLHTGSSAQPREQACGLLSQEGIPGYLRDRCTQIRLSQRALGKEDVLHVLRGGPPDRALAQPLRALEVMPEGLWHSPHPCPALFLACCWATGPGPPGPVWPQLSIMRQR